MISMHGWISLALSLPNGQSGQTATKDRALLFDTVLWTIKNLGARTTFRALALMVGNKRMDYFD